PDPQVCGSGLYGLTSLFQRLDGDDAAAGAVVRELHDAVALRKERVVLAAADVEARTEAETALAHEDRSAGDDVAVEALHAEALRIAVASVAGTALSLFVSHDLDLNFLHAHARERAAVTLRPPHALAPLLLEHADLRTA